MIDPNTPDFHTFAECLCKTPPATNGLGGKSWTTFGKDLAGVTLTSFTPKDPRGLITREEVFELVRSNASTADCVAAALAWGGMRMHLHKRFFASANDGWLEVAEAVRRGQLSRDRAFEAFRGIRARGHMKGVGVAFYTKLIYFLGARYKERQGYQGYIVDQWSGCAMNALLGFRLIHCNATMQTGTSGADPIYKFTVSDINTGNDYNTYCEAVEELVRLCVEQTDLELDVHDIDSALQGAGAWRNHVKEVRVK